MPHSYSNPNVHDRDTSSATHRIFWEAGYSVFGLYGRGPDGNCECGNPNCPDKSLFKHPRVSNWQYTPCWSEEQFETMELMGHFKTGWGLVLGSKNLLGVDVDARNGGLEGYAELVKDHPEVAGAGLIVNTGSGGGSKHLFFKVPEGVSLLIKLKKYKGIDFKSGASFVVGAGSVHASGNKYEIAVGSVDDIDACPAGLLEALRVPEKHRTNLNGVDIDVSHQDLADMLGAVDLYDDYEVWVKMGMAVHHVSGGSAFAVWDKWSAQSSKYDSEEMNSKWQSFGRSANLVTMGTLFHYAEQGGWVQPVTFTPANEFAEQTGWSAPEMRFLGNRALPAPALPLEKLVGDGLSKALRQIAYAKGAPVDYVFAALLTSVAALLSNHVVASPRAGWTEPAVLWSMIIGEPSAGKSPAFDTVITIMKGIEREINKEERETIDKWLEQDKIHQVVLKNWEKDVATAVENGATPPAKPTNSNAEKRPTRSRLMVNDITIERLAELIGEQEIGVMQFRDELAGWLEGMTRYTTGGSDRGFWLEAYGARPYTVDRMTRQVSVDRLAVCVLGGIQPDRMNSLLLGADDDGLLARLMPIWPDPAPITSDTVDYDDSILRHILRSLYRYVTGTVFVCKPEPFVVGFHEKAYSKLSDLRLRQRSLEDEEEGLTKSLLGKITVLTVRVALVLAFINAVTEGRDFPRQLSEEDFEAARLFTVDYVLPMVRRSYEMASVSKAERAARIILWLAKTKGWRVFSVREIKRLGRTGLTEDKEIGAALSMLLSADWIKIQPNKEKPAGGRPSIKYQVHPRLWSV